MNQDKFFKESFICAEFDEKTAARIIYKGQLVMSADEKPYLQSLLSQFEGMNISSVLEVGFGLGISAEIIQTIIRPSETHDIIEIESNIFRDLCYFSKRYLNVNPILGNFYVHDFTQTYDFIFYDPYDYGLTNLDAIDEQQIAEIYEREEAIRAKALLNTNGILCHPFFGDLEMPKIPGFSKVSLGSIKVPSFTLWNGVKCEVAQIGYYVKEC
jgi:hypothetical protein